jgi:hypothetical protein
LWVAPSKNNGPCRPARSHQTAYATATSVSDIQIPEYKQFFDGRRLQKNLVRTILLETILLA